MGLLSDIAKFCVKAAPLAMTIIDRADDIGRVVVRISDSVKKGWAIFNEPAKNSPAPKKRKSERPDVMGRHAVKENDVDEIRRELVEYHDKLSGLSTENSLEHCRIALQMDIVELISTSNSIPRFIGNITIHASNLDIHLKTIYNTASMLDDVNHQRVAVKALMKTVNQLIYHSGIGDKVDKISGIDVDAKLDIRSIEMTYEAFGNTYDLLIDDVESFLESIADQQVRIARVRTIAQTVPDKALEVLHWLNDDIEPELIIAKQKLESLRMTLLSMPELKDIRSAIEAANKVDPQYL